MRNNNHLYLFALSVILLYVFTTSCNSDHKIREGIENMQSSRIQLFQDSMLCINEDETINAKEQQLLKLVLFVDSSECSSCNIKKLWEWPPYLKSFDGLDAFKFLVVLEVKSRDLEYSKERLKITGIRTPVFFDTLFVFRRHNPQIPDNRMFHTFLLDESDSVLLVGNPLINERIDKLLKGIVNERLMKYQSVE